MVEIFVKEGDAMRCGAKCFLIQYEVEGEMKTMSVNARTPAEARKMLRVETNGKGKAIRVKVKR